RPGGRRARRGPAAWLGGDHAPAGEVDLVTLDLQLASSVGPAHVAHRDGVAVGNAMACVALKPHDDGLASEVVGAGSDLLQRLAEFLLERGQGGIEILVVDAAE